MRKIWFITCLLLILPVYAYSARLIVAAPPNVTDVYLLSPGTVSVLDHIKSHFKGRLKAINEKYQVEKLDRESKEALIKADSADKAYKEKIDALRKEYISKISITILSANVEVTPQSALGDINYTYTVKNNSDRIVSDIIYKPLLNKSPLSITSSLVLEFMNPSNLVFGIGPGEILTNQGHDPEHLSFFLNELVGKNIKQIQSSLPGSFTIIVQDLHFLSRKGYKDQAKEMDVKEAFAGQLKPIESAFQQAQDDYKSKIMALTTAKKLYESESAGIMKEYRSQLIDLKKSSVRAQAQVDAKKNKGTMESVNPGKYYLYGADTNKKAFFKEINIEDGKNKIEITSMGKDPFLP
jgi:hypothetical protein